MPAGTSYYGGDDQSGRRVPDFLYQLGGVPIQPAGGWTPTVAGAMPTTNFTGPVGTTTSYGTGSTSVYATGTTLLSPGSTLLPAAGTVSITAGTVLSAVTTVAGSIAGSFVATRPKGEGQALAAVYYCGHRGGAEVGLIGTLVAAQGAKRKRAVNQQCRVDELRIVLRTGDPEARRIYQRASSAWDEAGQPDVPLITEWFAQSQAGLTDRDS